MAKGHYAEMPPYTDAELAEKSNSPLDRAYLKAGLTFDDRLTMPREEWDAMKAAGRFILLPNGRRAITIPSPGRKVRVPTEDNPLSAEETHKWIAMGLEIDERLNLPINPRAEQVLTTPGFGMLLGMGIYWKRGPNRLGNVGHRIKARGGAAYAMARVERGHGNVWGLAGGHEDDEKDLNLLDTALREGEEETGIPADLIYEYMADGLLAHHVVRDWPQGNRGATAHAWQEGEFHFFSSNSRRVSSKLGGLALHTNDPGEVNALGWVPLEAIRAGQVPVMGSHLDAINAHEQHLEALQQA